MLLARHKNEGDIYAIKVLQKQAIMKRNEAKHIMAERNVLLKNIQHPFLVGLHYSFQTPDKLYFVLDYVNGGEVSCECHSSLFVMNEVNTWTNNILLCPAHERGCDIILPPVHLSVCPYVCHTL